MTRPKDINLEEKN